MSSENEQLKPFEARAIIEQLRKGTVPVEHVARFTVGRQNWLKYIEDDLQNFIAEGGSKVRFINGDYGDGKTHFMSIIRHLALQQKFAVSFVVLTRDVPIQKFEVIYQELVAQLIGQFSGTGIRAMLNHWLTTIETDFNGKKEDFSDKLLSLNEQLKNLPEMNINFSNALVSLVEHQYGQADNEQSQEDWLQQKETLYLWFEGGKISKRELKPLQIFEALNKNNSKTLLRSLISFLHFQGYSGFILLLDELETIMAQSNAARNAAYENVRLLIDNTEQSSYFHIFFSIIPDILNAEKGFKSYDALWSRIRSICDNKRLNYRSVLIDLHQTPLETKELIQLGKSICQIHEISYRWSSDELINNDLFEKICVAQERMGLLSEVRLFIKQVIRYLDIAEQGEVLNDEVEAQVIQSQQEMEQEKLEQCQPDWDK